MILKLTMAAALTMTMSAEPVYEGEGWKALDHIRSISTYAPYEINFGSEYAKSMLQGYARNIAAQITTATGVEVIVTDDISSTAGRTCASTPYHEITIGYKHQASATTGYNVAFPCAHSDNQSAYGGWLFIDSDYWASGSDRNWIYDNPQSNWAAVANVVSHEVGHVFGLDHAGHNNTGVQPVMYDNPIGGYLNPDNAGKFTPYDVVGLRQMVANYNG